MFHLIYHINNKPVLILDIHSYPNKENNKYDIYLLDYVNNNLGYKHSYYIELETYIKSKSSFHGDDISIGILIGSVENDIIIRGQKNSISSILIEINESITKEKMKKISVYVSEWIRFYLSK